MKYLKRATKSLAARTGRYEETIYRQDKGFRPNATGPVHAQHAPGSMQKGRCR